MIDSIREAIRTLSATEKKLEDPFLVEGQRELSVIDHVLGKFSSESRTEGLISIVSKNDLRIISDQTPQTPQNEAA